MSAFDVQAKLVRYKAEAAEGAELVRQLSSRAGQVDHSLTVEKLQQQLQTQKVRHFNTTTDKCRLNRKPGRGLYRPGH